MKKIILMTPLLLIACQKNSEIKLATWEKGQNTKVLKEVSRLETIDTPSSIYYKEQKIEFKKQSLDQVEIDKTFIKKIYDKDNEVILAKAQYVDLGFFNSKKISSVSHNSEKMIEDLKKKIEPLKIRKYEIKPFIKHSSLELQEWTSIDYELSDGTLWQAQFDNDKNLSVNKKLGSQFEKTQAQVYTNGPKLSSLTEVELDQISLSPSVNNSNIFVDSEASKKIQQVLGSLKFDPKDERFDQVQAFYYLDLAQNWMKNFLKVRFPEKLTAVVYVGYPEKTNTAFYYQNKIRLGHGDGENYSMIASDPSIVYHESFHALVDGLAHLPFEGEGGSLNEAFADFYTCVALGRPYLGESSYMKGPYKRTLLNNKKLDEKNGGLYGDSLIISGLLWDIKEKLGQEKALQLASEILVNLSPISDFADFQKIFSEQVLKLSTEDKAQVLQIAKARSFIYE